jgi:glycosyltransferase involved in cell wall biosynthesis
MAFAWLLNAIPSLMFLKQARLKRFADSGVSDLLDGPIESSLASSVPREIGQGRFAESSEAVPFCPKISVIVPARDEEEQIVNGLSSLLDQDYPNFEVIAVNDRSTDRTGQLMDRLALGQPELTILHIEELPEGWLGKTHALHRGAERATGEYLLLTDGDVVFARETLRLAMRYVQARQIDHLCLLPQALTQEYWETALTQFFGLLYVLATRPWTANHSWGNTYVGVGAFNLVRSEAYRSCGGHAKLRLEVVDDMALGYCLRQQGFRSQLLIGNELLSLRWHRGVSGLIRGIEKNSFAALNFSLVRLSLFTLLFVVGFFVPYWMLLGLPQSPYWGFAVTVLILHGWSIYWSRLAGHSWKIGLALPGVALLSLWALWRSAVLTLYRGGVCWRETFYSLAVLRGRRD